ncbi:hypothetical protein HHI36_016609, partial [Cryptolaemus montrouzieri]
PSPSLRPKSTTAEEPPPEQRTEEYSGGSLAGSIASGSSGFGSLPKKRPALLSSELVIGQTLSENNIPVSVPADSADPAQIPSEQEEIPLGEPGHSRNSSNTSQLSKASGYSSIHSHSHSRQSSSGDSGHIRNLHSSLRIASIYRSSLNSSKFTRTQSFPTKISPRPHTTIPSIPSSIPSEYKVDQNLSKSNNLPSMNFRAEDSIYSTPKNSLEKQNSNISSSSNEEYKTPEVVLNQKKDVFSQNFNELQKSFSTTLVEFKRMTSRDHEVNKNMKNSEMSYLNPGELQNVVMRSKSDYELSPISSKSSWLSAKIPESLYAFLTPSPKRKNMVHSTPTRPVTISNFLKVPPSPLTKQPLHSLPESSRTTSLNGLQIGGTATGEANGKHLGTQSMRR